MNVLEQGEDTTIVDNSVRARSRKARDGIRHTMCPATPQKSSKAGVVAPAERHLGGETAENPAEIP